MRNDHGDYHSHMDEETEALCALKAVLKCERVLPVLQLGSGRSSVGHKFQVITQACFCEAGDTQELLQAYMGSVDSYSGDMGVEFGVPSIRNMRVSQVLPWIKPDIVKEGQIISENEEWVVGAKGIKVECEVGLESALRVPTLMHVISNASNDFVDVCPGFSSAIDGLTAVAKLLDSKYTAKRLKAACFSGALGESLHADLDPWRGRIHKMRWGTVDSCIVQVQKLKPVLRWGWDSDKYLHMSGGGGVSDEGMIAKCNEAITSEMWWARIMAMEIIALSLQSAQEWCACCPCHWESLQHCHDKAVKSTFQTCPMRGRRAPELAAGDFVEFFRGSVRGGSAKLALKLGPLDLTQPEKSDIVAEFECSIAKLLFTFEMKCAPLKHPPGLLFVIAHHDQKKAHWALEQCLLCESQHPQIRKLKTTRLENEAVSWLAGEELEVLPGFAEFLSAKKFSWTCPS